MEYSKINYFENAALPKHREFIISQNNCALCGTVLELTHTPEPESEGIKKLSARSAKSKLVHEDMF